LLQVAGEALGQHEVGGASTAGHADSLVSDFFNFGQRIAIITETLSVRPSFVCAPLLVPRELAALGDRRCGGGRVGKR